MKKVLILILTVTIVFGLIGCTPNDKTISDDDKNKLIYGPNYDPNADNGEYVITDEHLTNNEIYYDLSSDSPLEITDTIEKDKVYFVDIPLYTNSTEITIQNQTDVAVTVYLYNKNDIEEPVLQMTVGSEDKEAFTNLTSRFVYYIGVLADEPMQLDIVVSD